MLIEVNFFKHQLESMGACRAALQWVELNDIESEKDAWAKCDNPQWLLWYAIKTNVIDRSAIAGLACDLVDSVTDIIPDDEDRPVDACRAVRKWIELSTDQNTKLCQDAAKRSMSIWKLRYDQRVYEDNAVHVAEAAGYAALSVIAPEYALKTFMYVEWADLKRFDSKKWCDRIRGLVGELNAK